MAATNLFLGFGGTGAHILTFLKEFTVYKHGSKPDGVMFLEFDTIAGWKPGQTVDIAGGGGGEEVVAKGYEEANSLQPQAEYFQLMDRHPSLRDLVTHHLSPAGNPGDYPQYRDWLHSQWLSTVMPPSVLNITAGSAQQRQIGRFSMFTNAEKIIAQLSKSLRELSRAAAGGGINVWVIGSAAGGTGAGCMLDAGYLARLAAKQAGNIPITLLTAVIFPEVYSGKFGISQARAYSLFRELDRLQEKHIPTYERYLRDGDQCSSEVQYDDRGALRSILPGRLFDYQIFLGRQCHDEAERVAFFSSVANALDPYVDPNIGPQMMEELVNLNGLPFTVGGARLTMPLTTYAELFTWEMVDDVLVRLFAPRQEGNQIVSLAWGSDTDRKTQAKAKVAGLLPLFGELLAVAAGPAEQVHGFAVNRLNPREIVEKWYQFASAEVANRGLRQDELDYVIPLVYRNPLISLERPEEETSPKDIAVKTYEDRRKAKEAKEDQEQSRNRFAGDLRSAVELYLDPKGGEGSFEHGRRTMRKAMTEVMRRAVDETIAAEFGRDGWVGTQPKAPDQGTPLTRLYGELRHLIGPEGPLNSIENMLAMVIESLQGQEKFAAQSATDALAELERARAGGLLSFGNWVEEPQRQARDRYSALIAWRQKRHLTEDMRDLTREIRKRFEAWHHTVEEAVRSAVLSTDGSEPALKQVRDGNLARLKDRLLRMTRDASTMISLQPNDTTMQGFMTVLRNVAVMDQDRDLATAALEAAAWKAEIGEDGRPRLALNVGEAGFDGTALARLHDALYARFRPAIDQRLQPFDIFDYLLYVKDRKGITTDAVVEQLGNAAKVLLDVSCAGICRWVYARPSGEHKARLVDELNARLRPVAGDELRDAKQNHSDRTSLTLLRAAEPDPDKIPNLLDCQRSYVQSLSKNLGMGAADDHEVQRSMIYHAFRGEAEAWFIERQFARERQTDIQGADQLIPPRIARLLGAPDFCQAFIQCLAAQAIVRDEESLKWVWRIPDSEQKVVLSRDGATLDDDFISAAVTFILQRSEAKLGSRVTIGLDAARTSASHWSARINPGKPLHQVVADFVAPAALDKFLATALPEPNVGDPVKSTLHRRNCAALGLIFRFYGRPGAQTALSSRNL
ncbi:tubulin-like doman-containing protein [Paramagnetospirillum magneticum]|uniref:Tubulin like n=1 Tax=Paramagnetospirillum magneticum (strain ATCC 700264 / AMB-1) TaxID=342108 RepID=Q2W313_PARM1|nr:tubulin-like doman-containing protein [Paramagnetospirillum magneticum]BAE51762.1 hypothetical protein amb2958 [Paramagnetospirillum magneticum AMB-1]